MSRTAFVVEADGGSRGNPGPAAYGTLVRDADTLQVLAREGRAIGVASNNVAEYQGLVAGLLLAAALDPGADVEVRMDSKLVVEQMSGRWQVKHADMRRLAGEARAAFAPAQVRYTWVPRAQNKDADRLVNEALDDHAKGRPWRGLDAERAAAARAVVPGAADDAGPDVALAPAERLEPAGGGGAGDDATPAAPTTLLLLRHGITEDTVAGRYAGRGGADLPLTDLGRRQALAAGEAVRERGGVDVVLTSPLRRARETAAVVAGVLGMGTRVDDGWAELDFGAWEGRTGAQVAARWPAEHAAWLGDPAARPPGGESLQDLDLRLRAARARLLGDLAGRRVLVVSHGGPLRATARDALGLADVPAGDRALLRLGCDPASLAETAWWPDGGTALTAWNETAHLRAAGVPLR